MLIFTVAYCFSVDSGMFVFITMNICGLFIEQILSRTYCMLRAKVVERDRHGLYILMELISRGEGLLSAQQFYQCVWLWKIIR